MSSSKSIDASIEERLAQVDFGRELAEEGITTVALDGSGQLVEHRPDGTSQVLPRSPVADRE